jgi:hypothetical protein
VSSSSDQSARRVDVTRKEFGMNQGIWLLQVLLALAGLMRLLHAGRRNGWI